jgi:hypothetical protein
VLGELFGRHQDGYVVITKFSGGWPRWSAASSKVGQWLYFWVM